MKSALAENFYPSVAEIAEDEGFDEIAEKMRLAALAKESQINLLDGEIDRIKRPDSLFSENPETLWHCRSCGYDIRGNVPPERCPLCSYPSSSFIRM
jgi:rubrerythrin